MQASIKKPGDGQAIKRPTRSSYAFERIRDSILFGSLKPGTRLVERELCELTGVSRTSVREALRRLEAESLVQITPNKRPVISVVGEEEVRQIFQLRVALEGLACQLFVTRATEEEFQALELAYRDIERAFKRENHREFIVATNTFYDVILRGSGNKVIHGVINTLKLKLTYLRRIALSLPGRGDRSIRSTKRIVEASRSRDPQFARDALVQHLAIVEQNTLEALEHLNKS